MTRRVVDPRHAKGEEYLEVIKTIEAEGGCPFCPANFVYHKEPILVEHGDWLLTRNSWPYPNSVHHLLIICKTHKEHVVELEPADWQSVSWLVNWAIANYDIKGGALAIRFGDTSFTGATVCHLHVHLIVPEPGNPVLFPVG